MSGRSRQQRRRPPTNNAPAQVTPEAAPEEPAAAAWVPPAWLDWVLRIGGGLVGLWAGVLLAVYGAFLTPYRIGSVLVPISLVLAIGGNVLLIWFTYEVTRHKFMALIPSLVWVVLSFLASTRTTEGDLVMVQSWVSIVYLLGGSLTIGLVAYRMILPPRP